jgi:hypothetical protein
MVMLGAIRYLRSIIGVSPAAAETVLPNRA